MSQKCHRRRQPEGDTQGEASGSPTALRTTDSGCPGGTTHRHSQRDTTQSPLIHQGETKAQHRGHIQGYPDSQSRFFHPHTLAA